MKAASLLLAALLLVVSTSVSARKNQPYVPGSGRQISGLLTVSSTEPVIRQCGGWYEACFRVGLRIVAKGAGEIAVGHIPPDNYPRRGGSAMTGAGVSCVEIGAVGLPNVVVWSSGDFTWRQEPFPVSAAKPVTLWMDFGCDAGLAPGDEVAVELILAVDPDGRDIRTAHYTLTGLRLKPGPR
jgi:hypothetical protein